MRHQLRRLLALGVIAACSPVACSADRSTGRDAGGDPGLASVAALFGASGASGASEATPSAMLAPRRIAGRVTVGGKPVIADVMLADLAAPAGAEPVRRTTGPDGRFDLGDRRGRVATLIAAAPGAAPRIVDLADAAVGDALALDLTAPCHAVEGTVRDGAGPVVGATLSMGALGVPVATTDDRGGYQLCVGPGALAVDVRAVGHAATAINRMIAGATLVDVTLPIAGPPLRGSVVNLDGEPVAGARVLAFRPDRGTRWFIVGHTAADGSFRFDDLTAGETSFAVDPSWALEHGLRGLIVERRRVGGAVSDVVLRVARLS